MDDQAHNLNFYDEASCIVLSVLTKISNSEDGKVKG
jgi:hypothetical protein